MPKTLYRLTWEANRQLGNRIAALMKAHRPPLKPSDLAEPLGVQSTHAAGLFSSKPGYRRRWQPDDVHVVAGVLGTSDEALLDGLEFQFDNRSGEAHVPNIADKSEGPPSIHIEVEEYIRSRDLTRDERRILRGLHFLVDTDRATTPSALDKYVEGLRIASPSPRQG